jgi:hypothetical protein
MDSQSAVILKPVFVPARLPQNHELCDKFLRKSVNFMKIYAFLFKKSNAN